MRSVLGALGVASLIGSYAMSSPEPKPKSKGRLEEILHSKQAAAEQQPNQPLLERNPTLEELNRAFARRGRKLFGPGGMMGKG
jgi:hypothetical protein